jgi:hypothetical protein
MIHEHEFLGMTWHWLSRVYLNQRLADLMFRRGTDAARRNKGKWDAGVYRHGRVGGPMIYITAVSHKREGLEALSKVLLGDDVEQPLEHVEALIARRVRVLDDLAKQQAPAGSTRIIHERPVHISPGGLMEDDE